MILFPFTKCHLAFFPASVYRMRKNMSELGAFKASYTFYIDILKFKYQIMINVMEAWL
jgi:hypothetical protein